MPLQPCHEGHSYFRYHDLISLGLENLPAISDWLLTQPWNAKPLLTPSINVAFIEGFYWFSGTHSLPSEILIVFSPSCTLVNLWRNVSLDISPSGFLPSVFLIEVVEFGYNRDLNRHIKLTQLSVPLACAVTLSGQESLLDHSWKPKQQELSLHLSVWSCLSIVCCFL